MEITIDYESSWRNSFLDGNNNDPLPKEGRNYIGSNTAIKKDPNNFIRREITLDTVMGILNRLIGDQRRLYQSRLDPNYFFASIEPLVSFVDIDEKQTKSQEVIYLRNMKGSFDQNSFSGMIRVNDPLLNSDYASELWRVLALDLPEVLEFIVTEKMPADSQSASLDPLWIVQRFAEIDKLKLTGIDFKSAFEKLQMLFPEYHKLNIDDIKKASLFYCGALYAVVESLKSRFDLSTGLTKNNLLPGISKKGLTEKDFMKRFTTGGGKRIYGNPYILKEKIKGEGERISMLTKASGQLTITLAISREQGIHLKEMIECAGVSSFYLGKKGLAFVSSIRA